MKRKLASLVSFTLLLFTCCTGHTNDLDRGESLHGDHCQRCHKDEIYTRAERIVEDLPQLEQRVKQCELMNNLLWFDEEVNDVTAYLNAHFYLFGIK